MQPAINPLPSLTLTITPAPEITVSTSCFYQQFVWVLVAFLGCLCYAADLGLVQSQQQKHYQDSVIRPQLLPCELDQATSDDECSDCQLYLSLHWDDLTAQHKQLIHTQEQDSKNIDVQQSIKIEKLLI